MQSPQAPDKAGSGQPGVERRDGRREGGLRGELATCPVPARHQASTWPMASSSLRHTHICHQRVKHERSLGKHGRRRLLAEGG